MRARLKPVRLEIEGNRHKEIKKYLSERLNISEQDIFKSQAPLDLKYVYKLTVKYQKKREKMDAIVICTSIKQRFYSRSQCDKTDS